MLSGKIPAVKENTKELLSIKSGKQNKLLTYIYIYIMQRVDVSVRYLDQLPRRSRSTGGRRMYGVEASGAETERTAFRRAEKRYKLYKSQPPRSRFASWAQTLNLSLSLDPFLSSCLLSYEEFDALWLQEATGCEPDRSLGRHRFPCGP